MNIALIGTRDLSPEQVEILANKGAQLSGGSDGPMILSGNASGADQAWVSKLYLSEYILYLPWTNYERQARPVEVAFEVVDEADRTLTQPYWDEYAELTNKVSWSKLKFGTTSLQARNYKMIKDCDEVYAAPGWKDGSPTGGTAFGIFLAQKMRKKHNIIEFTPKGYYIYSYCGNSVTTSFIPNFKD